MMINSINLCVHEGAMPIARDWKSPGASGEPTGQPFPADGGTITNPITPTNEPELSKPIRVFRPE